MFVTNQETIVQCAKRCYENYPTAVNLLNESGITYNNTPIEYARMDNKFAKSRRGIGESSNLAQLALTYYWTNPTRELYDNFIILAVLAQVVIDGCKREYEVDALAEIDRIKSMSCMDIKIDNQKKDFPRFMKYTKTIETIKNGKPIAPSELKKNYDSLKNRINYNLVCPMNYLQDSFDKIPEASRKGVIDTQKFFIKKKGRASNRQMSKIRSLVEDYDNFIKVNRGQLFDSNFIDTFDDTTEKFIHSIRKIKFSQFVVNRLIETAMSLDEDNNNPNCKKNNGAKYMRRLLNTLYQITQDDKYDKNVKFLSNFAEKNQKLRN